MGISIYITVAAIIFVPLSQDERFKNLAIRRSAKAENQLTSVERIFEYTKLAPEQETAPKFSRISFKEFKTPRIACEKQLDVNIKHKISYDRKSVKNRIEGIIHRSKCVKEKVKIEKELSAFD